MTFVVLINRRIVLENNLEIRKERDCFEEGACKEFINLINFNKLKSPSNLKKVSN